MVKRLMTVALNPREKRMLFLGSLAVGIGVWLLVIEPLQKKNQAQARVATLRQQQLVDMQAMAQQLKQQQDDVAAAQLTLSRLANTVSINQQTVLKTAPLPIDEAKALFQSLALQGQVRLHIIDIDSAEVWFWQP